MSFACTLHSVLCLQALHYDSGSMRALFKNLTMANVKDYVSIGAGLAAIVGGGVTAAAIFLGGGDGSPEAATAPSATSVAASSTLEPTASPTPVPTATPAPTGEFLRVQFGTQQDPGTFLPAGDTVSPGDDIEVCAGEYLFAWVYHSFEPGTVIDTRFSDRAGVLFNPSIPVEPNQLYVWISVRVADTGEHTLSVREQGAPAEAGTEWGVNVTCES